MLEFVTSSSSGVKLSGMEAQSACFLLELGLLKKKQGLHDHCDVDDDDDDDDDDEDETKEQDAVLLVVLSIARHSWAPESAATAFYSRFDEDEDDKILISKDSYVWNISYGIL